MKRKLLNRLLIAILMATSVACTATRASGDLDAAGTTPGSATTSPQAVLATQEVTLPADEKTATIRPEGWTEETHGNNAQPNYAIVFPEDKVNQITIIIEPDDWAAMQDNMIALLGERGRAGQRANRAPGQWGAPQPPADAQPQQQAPAADGRQQRVQPQGQAAPDAQRAAGGMPGGGDMIPENPMWVPATIIFEGRTWTNVGVRYKGNSSLRSAWNSGTLKLPLKLDFDEFEDEYPEIKNQRFYGFKQLSLATNFGDASYMRETVAYDLLEEAGLVAAKTAFYEVLLDYGEGVTSLGLYTMIEVVDDTVIARFFGDDSGNIYEAEGRAASLARNTFAQIPESFQKENNTDTDWSDIEALYNVLHSAQRTSDPAAWRAALEAIFDVDAFLKWLALSAMIGHWDAYGAMSHNYYLYHDPATGRLAWISWDHNEVLGAGAGAEGQGRGFARGTSLDKTNVGENWPLIRYLLDDPVYSERYVNYVRELVNGVFDADRLAAKYQEMAALVRPYAIKEGNEAAFTTAVQQLTARTAELARNAAAFVAARE